MVYKRKLRKRVDWCYAIELPGSTKDNRLRDQKTGFPTKQAAIDAEAVRRVELKAEDQKAKAPVVRSLRVLLDEFLADFAGGEKTRERYRELADYLNADLLAKPITEVTALDLHKEWKRLAESGGHKRGYKSEKRPLSPKTVRNVCGVVSSAYGYAILYELVSNNPAKASKPPRVPKHQGVALSPQQQDLLVRSASPSIAALLELGSATGSRRGELLALEWSDLGGNVLTVARSLSQTRAGLHTKTTKTERVRTVVLDETTLAALEVHRKAQNEHRTYFGGDYQGNLIFANPDGTPLKPDSVSAAVSLLFAKLKLPKPKGAALHLLRHSHGSHLIAAGTPITEVSRRLGHSSPQTTMNVYAHALPNRDEEAAKKWEEFQRESKPKEKRQ